MRGLRKQARKGSLTSRERDLLLDQEKKFRKARRRSAPAVGAGLAGAAALLGTSAGQQVLENIGGGIRGLRQDALGARQDRKTFREQSKQDRDLMAAETEQEIAELKREELARQEAEETRRREEEMGMRLSEGADRIEEEEREEDRQNLLARADEFERQERERVTTPVTDVDFSMGPEGPTRDEFDDYRRQRAEELGAQVLTPEEQQIQRFRNRTAVQALRGDRSDLTPGDIDYTGGFSDPVDVDALRRGEVLDPVAMDAAREMSFDEYQRQRARDAAADFGRAQFDRAQRILSGELTGDPLIDFGIEPMDLAEEEDIDEPRSNQRERAQMAREAARARARARRRGEDGIPLREQSGPRVRAEGGTVEYARGGVSPMVNDLRRKIARKYGIK